MARIRSTTDPTRACRPAVAALLAALAVANAPPAAAAKVYRCGNAFQDVPCAEQKAADARLPEPVRIARDSPACIANAKEAAGRNERSDCAFRAREMQSGQPDAKAR